MTLMRDHETEDEEFFCFVLFCFELIFFIFSFFFLLLLLTINNKMPPRKKSTVVTEQELVGASNEELIDIINTNINTKQDELFTKYKSKVESQLEQDHELIESLQLELQDKNSRIEQLEEQLASLKIDSAVEFASPIRKKTVGRLNQDELAKEREHISLTLDMIELLTGVKVVNFENTEDEYIFDIKQSSMKQELVVHYQLVLSTIPNSEINYFPTFLDALEGDEVEEYENTKRLQKVLPEYLCENLSFPFDTLAQFYGKVNRALNKK
ncbi:conserved hypothetical protein [Candida tropicalis MYA-3404]|uniref:Monopolin complex subunit Csm1/Pcs1 C-terminal domain-containing protein n=1 Tax=Candida tropicalis (strain ATCC MYA-3404 / T1) TaxID=294747 RepID=C5MDS7_CANTT|nr:conserved hypothetical protein [Candida tropicalis MYA-3404]EER32159.1 conserved hypothetical protein [Candida tropicalis MYA-3404]KAG4405757.1 hypothetical protein JTP64_004628 [Candida tropicalis]